MNKDEFIKQCSSSTGLSQQNVRLVLESLVTTIKLQIAQGNTVSIYGFGKFDYTDYPAKKYYKPGEDEPIITKESRIPKFKPSKDFRSMVNQNN